METLGAVVVAAGRGSRMGAAISKQYLPLDGVPVLARSLLALDAVSAISDIALVCGADDVELCRGLADRYRISKLRAIVPGGSERQQSVYAGLGQLGNEWVIVHDGVRPFIVEDDVVRCWQAAVEHGAAVLAVPVKETVKVADPEQFVLHTPDRSSLWAIQTPQAFRREQLLQAHREAERAGFAGTDDAMLIERLGLPVKLVQGSYANIKITTPDDLLWAEQHIRATRKGAGNE